MANNQVQAAFILGQLSQSNLLLAGDFNAEPEDAAIWIFRSSERFSGNLEGPATLPSQERRIDYILAPSRWTLVDERILANGLSDHSAVLADFRWE